MANYKKSPIDELFYNLMGYYPTKEGAAYEIISTALPLQHRIVTVKMSYPMLQKKYGCAYFCCVKGADHPTGKTNSIARLKA